ncbi:tetratricopeptide repeat protein [Alkalilimnicola ehrlichii]|nr:tetratricopeptide repeat protein [Alkalilimnicola ehrlichii]
MRRGWALSLIGASVLAVYGCSSPADQAVRHYENGMALMAEGDLTRARLEFRNALQLVDEKPEAVYGLALIAERNGDWEDMFGLLNQTIEQDPTHWRAHTRLGRLLLAAGQLDQALAISDAALALQPEEPDVLALRAAVLYKLGDYPGAVAQAEKVLAKESDNVEALVVLATERLEAGEPEQAIRYLDSGLSRDESNVALHLFKIQALEQLGDSEGVEQVYRRLIASHPQTPAFRRQLAQFYIDQGRHTAAEEELRQIAADNPANLDAQLDVVRFANTMQGAEAALGTLRDLIADYPDNIDLQFALAEFHRAQGNEADARRVYREITDNAADNRSRLRAKGQLAEALLADGERAQAEALVAAMLKLDAGDEDTLYLNARLAIEAGRLDAAIADLRTILRDSPDSPRALMQLGRAHHLAGSPELADGQYQRAFRASGQAPTYARAYADFLLSQGRVGRAERILQDALATSPNDLATLEILAQARLRLGNLVGAQEAADRIRELDASAPIPDRIEGVVRAQQHDYDSSIAAFRRAVDSTPHDTQPMVALVRTYIAADRTDEAMSFLDAVLEASPANSAARLLKGQLHQLRDEPDEAAAAYRAALDSDPANTQAYRNLAALYMRQDRHEEAETLIVKGLEQAPDDLSLRFTQAAIYELTGRLDPAIAVYEELIDVHPNAEVVINNLAALLAEHRDDEASYRRAFDLAQRLSGSAVPQFKDTRGWTHYRMGNYREAVELIARAVELMPEKAVFRYHLGMSYLALEDKEAARRELQAAVDLAASSPFRQLEDAREALQAL